MPPRCARARPRRWPGATATFTSCRRLPERGRPPTNQKERVMTKKPENPAEAGGLSRRSILKGAAAGAAAGIAGFPAPAVHAQEPKVLRYLGTAVNQSAEIAKKVKEDTGITIEYVSVTTDDVTRRVITQPNSYDVVDTEYFSLKKLVPSGNLLAMDGRKIKNYDKITPVFTKGALPSGKVIGDQGT